MIRPLIVVIIVILLVMLARWALKQPKETRWQIFAVTVAVILIALAATGRLNWIVAAFAAAIPIARKLFGLVAYWPLFNKLRGHLGGQRPSVIETAYLHMTIDLRNRHMSGQVVKGQFANRALDSLSSHEMDSLAQELKQNDMESFALLKTYQQFQNRGKAQSDRAGSTQFRPGELSENEAYAILGLQPGASKQDIIDAHRRLMQKLHPDRGGSDYLATKINQAKDTLLKRNT